MDSDSIPPKLFRMRVLTEVLSVPHKFHRMDSKDPDIHVLDG